MPKIFTAFTRPEKKPEINTGPDKCERAGYIPAKTQIELMMNAGIRLGEYRKEMYDFSDEEEVPDDFRPPAVRNKAYDLADASMDMQDVNARLNKQKADQEKIDLENERIRLESLKELEKNGTP